MVLLQIHIRIQGFYDQKVYNFTAEKTSSNCIFSSLGLTKDVQATGEAFSPQNRTFSTSKHENFTIFSGIIFALPETVPDPAVKINADPEPEPRLRHWNKLLLLIAVSFSAMFEHDMEEKKNSRVEVKDVEADVMADMLRYPDRRLIETFIC